MSAAEPAMQQQIPAAVRRAAVDWLLELQADGASVETRERWQQWLAAHPDHRRAWQRVEAFGDKLQNLASPLAHAALAPPGSLKRRRAVKTLVLLLFASGSAWMIDERAPWRPWLADRRTGAGEQARIELADGTHVELNSGTALDIRFTASERRLYLIEGEIFVATAPDPAAANGAAARPFIVQTAQGHVQALGTRFSVRQLAEGRSGQSRVAVFDGAVELRPQAGSAQRLNAGQQTRFDWRTVGDIESADEGATAWMQGMIVAQDLPLPDFIAELGRHRPGYLGCDPALASLKVSGTYPLADTDQVLAMLVATLSVELRHRTRYWARLVPR